MKRSFFFLLVALVGRLALTQDRMGHTAPKTTEKPVALLSGLGIWGHPIATKSSQAQKFFDQGLVLLYGFNRYEALRSFRKASELDPAAVMPYWGIAMALGPYLNMDMDPDIHIKESCEAIEKGNRIEGSSAKERAWLKAAGARCPDYSDPSRYIAAMRELAAMQPDDPDVQTLFAESLLLPVRWKWYSIDGKPADGVEEAEHVLEAVMRRYPDHPGANHFYIHAVESSPNPERGIPSAQRLMGVVPAAGHIVHMPGHIWLVLGDFNNAAAVNERAAEVDRQYFAQTGVSGSYGMYYLHNLQFLLHSRAMQGRRAETEKAGEQMFAAAGEMTAAMPEMAEVFQSFVLGAMVRVRDWDKVMAASQPKSPVAAALWRHARALAYVATGDTASAKREREEFEALRKTLDRDFPWDTNKLGDVMDFAAVVLEARVESSPAKAALLWREAAGLQDRLNYDEPPAWYYPVRESLGASLLLAGDATGAESVFREGLRRSPNNGRMLFGLLESLKAQGKTDSAFWVQKEFEKAWKGADIRLSVRDL